MDYSVRPVDTAALATPTSGVSWVLCRADYIKGVFIPLAPLPPLPIKKERSDSALKSEACAPHPSPALVLSVSAKPAPEQSEGLVIDSDVVEWTPKDDKKLKELVNKQGKDWKKVANLMNKALFKDQEVRSASECAERWATFGTKRTVREAGRRWTDPEVVKMMELWLNYDGKWDLICESMERTAAACKSRLKKIVSDTRKELNLLSAPQETVIRRAQALYSSH